MVARAADAETFKDYEITNKLMLDTFTLTFDDRAIVKSTKVSVSRKSLSAVEQLLEATPSKPPTCRAKYCTTQALYGLIGRNAVAKWCGDHKKDGNVIVGCLLCSEKAHVTVNGTFLCLTHAILEVQKLKAPDTPITIVDFRGFAKCTCGKPATFGLDNKRQLSCEACALVFGALLGVELSSISPPPDMSARLCVGAVCATKEEKPQGTYITPKNERYCKRDRDKVIDAEVDKPFGERTTFKCKPSQCEGTPCTVDRCTEESVVRDDEKALCLSHWTGLDDDEKKAYKWTGTCYNFARYGPAGNVQGPKERCPAHRKAGDIDNTHPRCITCVAVLGWSEATMIDNPGECARCRGTTDDQWFPLIRQGLWTGYWQRHAALGGATIIHEWRMQLYKDDKLARIDLRIDRADGHTIDLIEIDEEAHWRYDVCDELARLRIVAQADPGKRVRVIRVNPDRPQHTIAKKITKKWVKELGGGGAVGRFLDGELEIGQVSMTNLERSTRLVEQVRRDEKYVNHVVYVDYPMSSPHLANVIGHHDDVKIVGGDGKYADIIAVPVDVILPVARCGPRTG